MAGSDPSVAEGHWPHGGRSTSPEGDSLTATKFQDGPLDGELADEEPPHPASSVVELAPHRAAHAAPRLSEDLLALESYAAHPPPSLVTGHLDAGSLAFTDGLPDRHKSWHAFTMALSVAAGGRFLSEYPVTRGPVVLMVEEGARWRIAERIHRLRRGLGISDAQARTLPIRFIVQQGLKLDRAPHVARLREDLQRGERPVLLVIDNLSRIHTGDENRPGEVGRATSALADLQREIGCSINLIHHDRKNIGTGEASASTNLRGSSDLDAWWRNRIYIGLQDDGTLLVRPHSKDGVAAQPYSMHLEDDPDGSVRLIWDGPTVSPNDAAVLKAVARLGIAATVNNVAGETRKGKGVVLDSLRRLVERRQLVPEDVVGKGGQPAKRYRLVGGPEGVSE